MSKAKARPKWIRARVTPAFHERCSQYARKQKMSLTNLVIQAAQDYISVERTTQREQLLALSKDRDKIQTDLRSIEERLQSTREQLAIVTDDRDDFQQQLEALSDKLSQPPEQLPLEIDKLKLRGQQLQADLTASQEAKAAIEATRDSYKTKIAEQGSKILFLKQEVEAYKSQGYWGRLFGRKPK